MTRTNPEDVVALAQLMKETFVVISETEKDGELSYDGRLAWSATCYLLRALWLVMPETDHAGALNLLRGMLELIQEDGRPRSRAPAGFRSGGRFR